MNRVVNIIKRKQFLNTAKNLDWERAIFLDETWINSNSLGARSEIRNKHYRMKHLETKHRRKKNYIVCHAGGVNGWIPAEPLIMKESYLDDTSKMNAQTFEFWFENILLPSISEERIIVMDNASFHSRSLNKLPCYNSDKTEIINWLNEHSLEFDDNNSKSRLLERVRANKHLHKHNFYVDKLAESYGHTLIRLPPYHSMFNPIELAWLCIKKYIRKKKTNNFEIEKSSFEEKILEGINEFTVEKWMASIDFIKNILHQVYKTEKSIGIEMSCYDESIFKLLG